MKKLITLITIIGLALSIGNTMAVSATNADDWDRIPDVFLPVR